MALGTPNQASILESLAAALYRVSAHGIRAPLERLYVMPHFLYFTDVTLTDTLCRGGLAIVERDRDVTDLRRLQLGLPLRLALSALFRVARITGGENRLFAIAEAVPE